MNRQIERKSNIELLRIIAMVMIVFHHYCVHGGHRTSHGPMEIIIL